MTKPKFKLIIRKDNKGELYAVTQSLNEKTIWRTSESYTNRTSLIKACRYIPKPAVIQIDLPNEDWKYIEKLNIMLDQIWD